MKVAAVCFDLDTEASVCLFFKEELRVIVIGLDSCGDEFVIEPIFVPVTVAAFDFDLVAAIGLDFKVELCKVVVDLVAGREQLVVKSILVKVAIAAFYADPEQATKLDIGKWRRFDEDGGGRFLGGVRFGSRCDRRCAH